MIKDSDLAGYNSDRFDIPLLAEELLRAGVDFDLKNRVTVDVQTIFHKMEQRTLSAAYKFYCKKSLDNAHSAEADTTATYEILKAQLDTYSDTLPNDIKQLSDFTTRKQVADFAGFIAYNEKGEEIFTFGKHKGRKVEEILEEEPGYFGWILNADFPLTILIGTNKYRRLFTDTLILGNIMRLATIYIKISAVYNYFAIPVVFIALDRRLRGIQRDFELDIGPVFLSVILFYICFYSLRERVLIIEVGF